jgi:hypothetical protein
VPFWHLGAIPICKLGVYVLLHLHLWPANSGDENVRQQFEPIFTPVCRSLATSSFPPQRNPQPILGSIHHCRPIRRGTFLGVCVGGQRGTSSFRAECNRICGQRQLAREGCSSILVVLRPVKPQPRIFADERGSDQRVPLRAAKHVFGKAISIEDLLGGWVESHSRAATKLVTNSSPGPPHLEDNSEPGMSTWPQKQRCRAGWPGIFAYSLSGVDLVLRVPARCVVRYITSAKFSNSCCKIGIEQPALSTLKAAFRAASGDTP